MDLVEERRQGYTFGNIVISRDTKSNTTLIPQEGYLISGVESDEETKTNPVAGGGKPLEVEAGMGKYKTVGSGEGEQKYTGAVMITGPDGTPTYYPFQAWTRHPFWETVAKELSTCHYYLFQHV